MNNASGVARDNGSFGGGIALASELIADAGYPNGSLYWNGTYTGPAEFWEKAMLPDNGFVTGIWLNAYEINNLANQNIIAIR